MNKITRRLKFAICDGINNYSLLSFRSTVVIYSITNTNVLAFSDFVHYKIAKYTKEKANQQVQRDKEVMLVMKTCI